VKVQCQFCGIVFIFRNVGDMRHHLASSGDGTFKNNCQGADGDGPPNYIKELFANEIAVRKKKKVDKEMRSEMQSKLQREKKASAEKQMPLRKAFENAKNDTVDKALGRFIFSSGSSFRIVDNVYFKKFIYEIMRCNQAHKLPNAAKLGGVVLDQLCAEADADTVSQLTDIMVYGATMGTDAATVHDEPLCNLILKCAVHSCCIHMGIFNESANIAAGKVMWTHHSS
jgi:hypothetical protein